MGYSMMDFVEIVNRTTRPLEVTFSGVTRRIRPGYKELDGEIVPAGKNGEPAFEMLPAPFADFAKRQNPQMGTFDPSTSNVFEPLVGVTAWGDDVSYLADSGKTEVIDRELLPDDRQHPTIQKTTAGRKAQRRQQFSDQRLKSPSGLDASYND